MELKELAFYLVSVIPFGFLLGLLPHIIGLGIDGVLKIIKTI